MRLPSNRGGLRTYLILLGLLAGHATPLWVACGTPFVLAGIALHLWAKGCLYQELEVTTAGPYRFVRHPFYLANLFLDLGIGIMSGWWLLQLVLPFWWLAVYIPTMRREESKMTALFGDRYTAYRNRLPPLIPCRRPLPEPAAGFSWRNRNLARTEIPRAFNFLCYPLLFLISYRLHSVGAAVFASPTFLDVLLVAACGGVYATGRAWRWHFRRHVFGLHWAQPHSGGQRR